MRNHVNRSILVGLLTIGAVGCKAGPPPPACPSKYHDIADSARKTDFTCRCAPNTATGTVWGSKIYTQDSSICAAAVHAGVITAKAGGIVTARPAPGCSAYTGSVANGVTTAGWGSFPGSFYFPLHGDGKCGSASAAAAKPPVPAGKPVAAPAPARDECPTTYDKIPAASKNSDFTCTCSSIPSGSVWGSGTYTTDSRLCRAALHAGVIGASGGKVTVRQSAGCPSYQGSDANGVKTQNWGSHQASFFFPAKSNGKCPAAGAAAAPPPPPPPACPASWDAVPNAATTAELTCSCASVPAAGSVWGSGIYTSDSSICRAAQHAGAVPAGGGPVTVKRAAGCSSYQGTTANGITTTNWGSHQNSFYFPSRGNGKCPGAAAAVPPAPPPPACPANWDAVPNGAKLAEYSCSCANVPASGAVWGSGIYTSDSSICRAALNAGAIAAGGGTVKIKPAPGCPAYKGSDANGIKSANWGSHGGSFYFVGNGDGKCK